MSFLRRAPLAVAAALAAVALAPSGAVPASAAVAPNLSCASSNSIQFYFSQSSDDGICVNLTVGQTVHVDRYYVVKIVNGSKYTWFTWTGCDGSSHFVFNGPGRVIDDPAYAGCSYIYEVLDAGDQ